MPNLDNNFLNLNYEKILKRSWAIAKTHRFLWVFGMTLAAFSGFGSRLNLNLPGGSDGQNFLEMLKGVSDRTPRESSRVLGAYTDRLLDVFRGVPVWIWVVLLLSVAIAVLVAILIGLYTKNWAKGALIASIHHLEENSQASLATGSQQGKTAVKRFIWLEVVPPIFLLLALGVLLLATGGLLLLVQSDVTRMLLFILGVAVILILGLTGGMLIAMGKIIAQQLVVRENLTAQEAWRQGFSLARRHLKEMFLMGAINLGIGCALGCATTLLLIMLAVIMLIVISVNKQIGLALAAGAALLVMALALFSILLRGIYMVFNMSTWTLLFRELEKRQQKGE